MQLHKAIFVAIAACSALLPTPMAHAQPHPGTGEPLVRASAHAEHAGIAPGQTVWVGVRFQIEDAWHIYWPGQNDTGFGTTVSPSGPAGVTFGPVLWPAPKRYVSPGDILDHVYENAVMALVPVTLSAEAEAGEQIELTFASDWLVCRELCIPGDATVSLTLPVRAAPAEPNTSATPHFAEARSRLPNDSDGTERVVTVEWHGSTAVIRARGAHHMAFYPDDRSTRVRNLLASGQAQADALRLEVEADNPRLSGYVEVTIRDQRSRVYRIDSTPQNPN